MGDGGSSRASCTEWGKALFIMEVGERNERQVVEGLSQEKGEFVGGWEDSCLAKCSISLRFSTEGFEGEILNLLHRMKSRREQGKKITCFMPTRFEHELKKLECSIDYNGGKKGSMLDKGGGAKAYFLT